MYSGKPTASLVVSDLVAAAGLPEPTGRRSLDDAGRRAVDVTAARLAQMVDDILEPTGGNGVTAEPPPLGAEPVPLVMCSRGSGIPVKRGGGR